MNLTQTLSASLFACCLAVPASFEVMGDSSGPIPPATEDIFISTLGEEPSSLFDVLSAVAKASGVQVHADSDMTARLKCTPSGFHQDFILSAGEAWKVAELMLKQYGFILSALHMGEAKVVAVHHVGTRQQYGWNYHSVSVEELDYVAAHPNFLFEVNMDIANLDVQESANRMHQYGIDRRLLQVIPVGSKDLMLRGTGSEVCSIARMLLETNERAGERAEQASKGPSEDQSATEDC